MLAMFHREQEENSKTEGSHRGHNGIYHQIAVGPNENEDERITITKNGSGEVKYKQPTREKEVLLGKCY